MKITKTLQLNQIPSCNKNYVITTTANGSPLSYVHDTKWDFSGIEKRAVGKPSKISFERTDRLYRKGIQSTLAYFCKEFESRKKSFPSYSQVDDWRKGLSQAAGILEGCDWASLSDDKRYNKFKAAVSNYYKENSYSESTFNNLLKSLNKLSEYNLCVRIFTSSDLLGGADLKDTKQHIAIPICMYQQLIAKSINEVEIYHPYRVDINGLMIEAHNIKREELSCTNGEVSNTVGARNHRIRSKCNKIEHNIPNFKVKFDGSEISKILTHCAIVTFAFSGVRSNELKSFSNDSYTIKYDGQKEISILEGETSKANEGLPTTVTWQTHPIVKDALELAYAITEHLRELYLTDVEDQLINGKITNDEYLHFLREIKSAFIAVDPSRVSATYTLNGLDEKFNNLISKSNIIATQDDVNEFELLNPTRKNQLKLGETLPRLSPHDFRRTFAVFFKRYGFGSASSIKFQYKHKNINMSEYYANNARLQAMEDVLMDYELLELMNEEGIQMGVDVFDEIYNQSEHLSGTSGERIAKSKFSSMKDGHRVFMSRSEIEILVRNGTLSVVKLATGGYCLNAKCSRVCGINQFNAEIKPCDDEVITDSGAKDILRQNKRLIKIFRDMNTGDPMMNSILIGIKQKIKRNEVTILKHKLSFETFDDVVKGTIKIKEV